MSRLDKFGTKFDKWMNGVKRDARPGWNILVSLAGLLGHKMKFNMAESVFTELSNTVDLFKGIDYDDIGETGTKITTAIMENKVNT